MTVKPEAHISREVPKEVILLNSPGELGIWAKGGDVARPAPVQGDHNREKRAH